MQDNDTPGYLAAGFLIAADQKRQADNSAYEAQTRNRELAQQASDLDDQLQRQAEQSREIESDYYMLFNLLKQPMHVIAERNGYFAQTYDASQQELAKLKLSELAFLELAIQLGSKIGMSPQAVLRKGTRMRTDVLQNRNPKDHHTNANVSPILLDHGNRILAELDAERKAFVEKYDDIVKGRKIYNILDGDIDGWGHFFDATKELALQGKREAQYNLGYCLFYAVGTKHNLDEAEQWLLKAQQAAEPASVMVLHYLYAWTGGNKYDVDKADKYLQLAEQNADKNASARRTAWEAQKQQDGWNSEEPQLLAKLLVITPGHRPPELDKIKGRGYVWEKLAALVHSCEYKFVKGETENLGSLFKPKRNTRCYLDVVNPSDISLQLWAHPEYDEKKHPYRPLEWNGTSPIVGAQRTTRLDMGKHHVGTQFEYLVIMHQDKEGFAPITRYEKICSGLKYGTLRFKLHLGKLQTL